MMSPPNLVSWDTESSVLGLIDVHLADIPIDSVSKNLLYIDPFGQQDIGPRNQRILVRNWRLFYPQLAFVMIQATNNTFVTRTVLDWAIPHVIFSDFQSYRICADVFESMARIRDAKNKKRMK